MSYGINLLDPFRHAAEYVDRILKGEKPAEMPVQAPTKYQLVINLKTAKEMDFTFPPAVLARADEVNNHFAALHESAFGPKRTSLVALHMSDHVVGRKRSCYKGLPFRLHAGACGIGLDRWRQRAMEVRWAGGNVDRLRMFAKELVDQQSDVILATSTPSTAALQQATRTIPIVFAGISDPVGAGFVASLSHRLHQHGRSICGQVAGGAHGDRAPHQASRNHVQSRHGSWWRIILSALIRCRSPKAQSRAHRSARS